MMETYFLWRFSMVLITVLAFSLLVGLYKFTYKLLHRRTAKECES